MLNRSTESGYLVSNYEWKLEVHKRNKTLFLFPDPLLSLFQLGSFQLNIPGTARFSSEQLNFSEREVTLKWVWHEIFIITFFSWISVPRGPKCPIMTVSIFFEISRRYSQMNVKSKIPPLCQTPFTFCCWLNGCNAARTGVPARTFCSALYPVPSPSKCR